MDSLKKIKQWWPVAMALTSLGVSFFLYFYPDWWFIMCFENTKSLGCIFDPVYSTPSAGPLYVYILRLLPITLIALFIPPPVFQTWLKFTLIWLAFSLLCIAYFPTHTTGGFVQVWDFTRMDAAKFMANGYAIVSVLIFMLSVIISQKSVRNYLKSI